MTAGLRAEILTRNIQNTNQECRSNENTNKGCCFAQSVSENRESTSHFSLLPALVRIPLKDFAAGRRQESQAIALLDEDPV
jgi:hypothetical protein